MKYGELSCSTAGCQESCYTGMLKKQHLVPSLVSAAVQTLAVVPMQRLRQEAFACEVLHTGTRALLPQWSLFSHSFNFFITKVGTIEGAGGTLYVITPHHAVYFALPCTAHLCASFTLTVALLLRSCKRRTVIPALQATTAPMVPVVEENQAPPAIIKLPVIVPNGAFMKLYFTMIKFPKVYLQGPIVLRNSVFISKYGFYKTPFVG